MSNISSLGSILKGEQIKIIVRKTATKQMVHWQNNPELCLTIVELCGTVFSRSSRQVGAKHNSQHSLQIRMCPKWLHLFLWRFSKQTETSCQNYIL